ncbi:rCG29048 [Rattus norvegicus]|uniref:RCG29048 n=1 Tax=Rattus norvegicus TaxID=10116 RepID=A6HW40_RAT|nr:rCG29048 [Rattus norvegicus]
MASPWATSPWSCLQSSKDSRKLPCSEHWGERTWIERFPLSQNYSRIRVPGWQLHVPLVVGPSTERSLRMRIVEAYRSWHLVHGKCWIKHKRMICWMTSMLSLER